ncbi:hypothetical protein Pmani_036862 [Petrolisthes manimaculis]|uniref:Uncharacterized protein n=1 Tax=Petrolisthes manimaculis TaxID=1843537 RepID=A0AAE1TNY9_9EUCA|nr:hypothetical protein Pmani_036862 [Petrolisthes manimaculis]
MRREDKYKTRENDACEEKVSGKLEVNKHNKLEGGGVERWRRSGEVEEEWRGGGGVGEEGGGVERWRRSGEMEEKQCLTKREGVRASVVVVYLGL